MLLNLIKLNSCYFLFLLLPVYVFPYNILVFSPAFAGSHMNFMAHLADTLTEAGHNVTFLVPVADEAKKHQLGVKLTKDVVVIERDEKMTKEENDFEENTQALWNLEMTSANVEDAFYSFGEMMSSSCANLMRNQNLYAEMKQRSFDVAITECLTVCGLGLFKKLGIEKTIIASSVTLFEFTLDPIGEPEDFSYVPVMAARSNDQMDFFGRYENYHMGRGLSRSMYRQFDSETKLYRKYLGEDLPDWRELFPAASLYFTNSNPYIDFPRPVIQKTIAIGGISVNVEHIRSQKLTEEWDEVLNKRNKTMLISFGSMVKSSGMPITWRQSIFEAIKSFKDVTFIWKYESDDTEWASTANNIHFSKWVPQTALLADSRLSAFLTHAGLGSINEVAHFGKPALMVPILGDQMRNAFMFDRHKGSITIMKKDLSDSNIVKNGIDSILYDISYEKNSAKIAELLENQPFKPKELVVKHTEFLAKYGPFPQMDPYSRQLNYFQKNYLDMYASFCLIYLTSLIAVLIFIRLIYFYIMILLKNKLKSE